MTPAFDAINPLPDGDELELVHERAYIVRAYRKADDLLVLRGALRDQKPPGMYIEGDPEPLTVHHMVVDLLVRVPSLEILGADVRLEMHPHDACPRIEDHYQKLVGLSIARGFTHKVRELFGGPRGCTHTTALLQAMGPVAVQSLWSFRMSARQNDGTNGFDPQAQREAAMLTNLNTCHIWAEDGEQVRAVRAGEAMEVPVWIEKRYAELGREPATWRN